MPMLLSKMFQRFLAPAPREGGGGAVAIASLSHSGKKGDWPLALSPQNAGSNGATDRAGRNGPPLNGRNGAPKVVRRDRTDSQNRGFESQLLVLRLFCEG